LRRHPIQFNRICGFARQHFLVREA